MRTAAPKYFGTFHLPQIAALAQYNRSTRRRPCTSAWSSCTRIGGYIFVALLVLHIGAALKHQFIDRQPELERMGIGRLEPFDRRGSGRHPGLGMVLGPR